MSLTNPFEISRLKQWINQFDTVDRYIGIKLLRSLKYVSFVDFEKYLQESIIELLKEFHTKDGKRLVAVFPVRKCTINKFNIAKEVKLTNDSAGRIGHALTNIERQLGGRIEVSPRKKSMVDCKVRNIIYVDDIVGSGERFIEFWNESVPRYVKAWASRGWCRIWVLSYVAHLKGIKKIAHNVGALEEDSFKNQLMIEKSHLLCDDTFVHLFKEYGARTHKKAASFGYGKLATPVVFQHGCPNNAPAILWAAGLKNPEGVTSIGKDRWNPLFQERGISSDLYPLFESTLWVDNLPEVLWSHRQYKLALSFLEQVEYPKRSNETLVSLTILALLSSKVSHDRIKNILMLNEKEYSLEVKKLIRFQLCNNEGTVTDFGKDVLARNKNISTKKTVENDYDMFYPSTFMGFQREV